MILTVDEVMSLPEFKGQLNTVVSDKLDAIEHLIRSYTHNNFQNRNVRFMGRSQSDRIFGHFGFLKVGDTVQVSQSCVNDGLYIITEIGQGFIRVNRDLFDVSEQLVTKVEYPVDVKNGVLEMLKWDVKGRDKVGVKSETLSRYSVTYFDMDSNNQVMGYPVSLLGFLKPYMKARF